MLFPECFDLHIHTRGQIELHERVYGLRCRIENIEQTLVRANLELFPRLFVHMRGTQHTVLVFHRGQRNRACNLRAGAFRGGHNFCRRLVKHAVIVCLQPDANFFVSYHVSFPDPFRLVRKERTGGKLQAAWLFYSGYCTISLIVPAPTVWPPSRMAKRKPFSIATGVISSITSCTLSPGITISVPEGSSATPVTSVVRR